MKTHESNFEAALEAAKKGSVPVAILPGSKVPAEIGWDGWMKRPVTDASAADQWKGERSAVMIACTGPADRRVGVGAHPETARRASIRGGHGPQRATVRLSASSPLPCMETPRSNLETALLARRNGLVAIPCHPGSKVPAVRWKEWQHAMPPWDVQRRWFEDTRVNIAILTTGLVIFDCDDAALADLVLERCGDTPHKIRTPRGGIHLGYRRRKGVMLANRLKVKGMAIDIRTDGGLEVIPNSVTADGRYEWLGNGLNPISDLPVAAVGWTRERTRAAMKLAATPREPDAARLLFRGRRYVDTFPRCVSGQSGHRTAFIASLKICRFVGKDADLAWQLLCYYNATKCDPEWSERELKHKHEDGLKRAR